MNQHATTEQNSHWEQNKFDPDSNTDVDNHGLKTPFLDTRSLRMHAADTSKQKNLIKTNILCLT